MPAYTLKISTEPQLVNAHNDAGAIALARAQVEGEFSDAADEATLGARVTLESKVEGVIYESTVGKMLGKRRARGAVQRSMNRA